MKLLFIDTETTGISPQQNGVVQISGIIDIDGEVKEEFDFHCRPFPNKIMDIKALEVIGKTKEEVLALPDPREAYQKILTTWQKHINRYDKNDKFYMVGQNTKFDYDMMTQFFKDNGNQYFYAYVAYHLIDIITITALFNLAGIISTKNMKLETVAQAFNIPLKAHDSLHDIRATRQIFYKFMDHVKQCKEIARSS